MALTQERLKELLSYDPETGLFRWIKRPSNRVRVGSIAGNKDKKGYIRLRLDGVLHHAHRLAVLYMTGRLPSEMVDHISGVRDENRWANLRECSPSENLYNAARSATNTSGFKGVTWHKQVGKWMAQISANNRHIGLGVYTNKEDAYAAYCNAAARLHGEFARFE